MFNDKKDEKKEDLEQDKQDRIEKIKNSKKIVAKHIKKIQENLLNNKSV